MATGISNFSKLRGITYLGALLSPNSDDSRLVFSNRYLFPSFVFPGVGSLVYDLSTSSEMWLESRVPDPIVIGHFCIVRMKGLRAFGVRQLEETQNFSNLFIVVID